MAHEARVAKLKAIAALYEGLGAAYDFPSMPKTAPRNISSWSRGRD